MRCNNSETYQRNHAGGKPVQQSLTSNWKRVLRGAGDDKDPSPAATGAILAVRYCFGDEYLNEVIEQRLISNPRLRLIVVSPDANKVKQDIRFLRDNPKVIALAETAKETFERMTLLREVRKVAGLVRDETPFP